MNQGKKRTATALVGLMCLAGASYAQAPTDMPLIMTLKTNIYGYQGPTNTFTIYLGSTQSNVEVYVEGPSTQEYVSVNPWSLGQDEDGDNAAIATAIGLNVSETDNEIRIYGDKSKIDYIDVHGCYLSSVELEGEFPNLTVFDASHNELTAIDLSPQVSLASIDIYDNSFNEASKMVIGTNHPNLLILSVGVNDVIDPQLDLKNFPKLQYFSARSNYGVYNVDPTNCPDLVSLVLEITNVSSIDVSKNPNLDVLNLSQTRVNSVDVSNNPLLGELYVNHEGTFNNEPQYKLTSIDISKNPLIEFLDLGGNALSSIDLSNNPQIKQLYLQRNNLSSIDISNLKSLANFSIAYNNFTFATLPLPDDKWAMYYYYRAPLPCDFKYKVGEPIDFSSSVIRAPYVDAAGNTVTPETVAAVFSFKSGEDPVEVSNDKYTFNNGIITFKEAIPDSVFVSFHCSVFEEYSLETQNFMVKTVEDFDAPSAVFSFNPKASMAGKQIALSVGASPMASTVTYPADATIIIGDNQTLLSGVITSSSLPQSPNIVFTMPETTSQVIVALPDGFAVSSIGMDGVELLTIDLSPSEGLTNLSLTNCGLSTIDLGYNRALRTLDLSGNQLRSLDLAGIRGDYEKFSLANINLANNMLTQLSTVSASTIYNLDLSGNNFTQFDLKYYTGLQTIDLSNNKITGTLDFSTVEKLQGADVSGNSIQALVFNTEEEALDNLSNLNVSNNNLTFVTLPTFDIKGLDYVYAPQNVMQVLSTAAAINLSDQNIVKNGVGTTFTWKFEDGSAVPSTDYSNDGGATIFNETLVGSKVYCEMTNPLFPAFDAKPLTTSIITVATKPSVLVGSFVTPESGTAEIGFIFNTEGDNAVYIDWRGDGSEYTPYLFEANKSYPSRYQTYPMYAGANVKIYAYETAEDVSVFMANNTPMSSLDLTPMTKLTAINVHNAGLTDGSLKLPDSQALREIILDGNNFQTMTFENYPRVGSLNLAGNQYESIDLSVYKNLGFAQLSNNRRFYDDGTPYASLKEVTLGPDNNLIQLDLTNNALKSIDLSTVGNLEELLISDNQLTSINVSNLKNKLRALLIGGNYFTFATLPDPMEMGEQFYAYSYGFQHPVEVNCYEWKIDLSSQANVYGVATEYLWFLGDNQSDVYFDYETEMFVGEQLQGPDDSDDPEYTIENGVTTFLYPQSRKVIGAMTNSYFPSLILYTVPVQVSDAGVGQLFGGNDNGLVDVVTLTGVTIKRGVNLSEAVEGLAPGIYIIGGKKVMVK